jgi:serine phosphatase RsbU (regulator of sigma subunit)
LLLGDKLVLYTDGLVDAGSPAAEPFGEKRFRAAMLSLADTGAARLTEGVMAEVDAYLGGRPLSDDMTILCAELSTRERDDDVRPTTIPPPFVGMPAPGGGGE